ncbi:MAG: phenylalanine--tRNA ligase subunit beta [Planctomycetes bacterium GWF2_42_9]|nr:MAG: phenylalanine--tRNA ligase subunit beta [Planctomycetes bacterium GWF2_42_9]HAL44892.1 phenylalanine--tRNA ligase subunit beta [Phycisphaerales bacterium]
MKTSLNWLKEYVSITESPQELAALLSGIGFNIESVEIPADDAVIDVEVTSNRGDCLSHIGVAREIAAATGRELNLPKVKFEPVKKDINSMVSVEIADAKLCGRYTARIIEGVKVGSSPEWMVKRLEAVGLRSVNNVVDATNYAMMETGQPPHAFDYNKIRDGKIIVRLAKKDEKIVSIDGTNCALQPDMLAITDPTGPIAVAGVMGGLETEVGISTTTILLEEASFNPVVTRKTSRALNLPSEAAYRFGRGVDIEQIDWASQRTAQLIVQVAGGKIVEGVVDVYPAKAEINRMVAMRPARVKKVLGIEIPQQTIFEILRGLCFSPQKPENDKILCTIPTWRNDITREIDLIEEVGRIYGYDKLTLTQKINIEVAPVDRRQQLVARTGGFLNSCGFYESITPGFNTEAIAKLITPNAIDTHLAVRDENSKTANMLRSTLIGSLLEVFSRNVHAGTKNIKLYELASVFAKTAEGKHTENSSLAAVCDADFRIIRGAVEGMIRNLSPSANITFEPTEIFWANTGAKIIVNGNQFGVAGVIKDQILSTLDIKIANVCAAEINFDMVLGLQAEQIKAKPLPKFPSIVRDLSLIVDEPVQWSKIQEVVSTKAPAELETLNFVGIYRGKPIPAGKKSVTLSLCFRDEDGTLKHEIVDGWQKDIVAAITSALGAELRVV